MYEQNVQMNGLLSPRTLSLSPSLPSNYILQLEHTVALESNEWKNAEEKKSNQIQLPLLHVTAVVAV